MKAQRTEKGQAIVLIALALVAMIGFGALAVDAGRDYAERRRAQNAADTAAFAAAFHASQNKNATNAELEAIALAQAAENGFVRDAKVDIAFYHPPIDPDYATRPDADRFYQVIVSTAVAPIFSQVLSQGERYIQVEAIAEVIPSRSLTDGNALHATSKDASPAMWFAGGGGAKADVDGNVTVNGGNIFSNSNALVSGRMNGSGKITVNGGNILVVGGFDHVGSGLISPAPTPNVAPQALEDLPVPDCTTSASFPERTYTNQPTMEPGLYKQNVKINNGDVHLKKGMYCFKDGFDFKGGRISSDPEGVFLVVLGGDISINGNSNSELYRPNGIEDQGGTMWSGMLIYVAGNGEVKITGGASLDIAGTIYAPKSHCDIGGNSKPDTILGFSSSVVCDTVKVHGSAKVQINYRDEENAQLPPKIQLHH